MLVPVAWFVERGADNPSLLHLTSGVLMVAGVFFAAIAGVLQVAN